MKLEVIFSASSSILSSFQLSFYHDSVVDDLLQTNRGNDPSITTLTIETDIVNSAINKGTSLHRRFNLKMFRVILTDIEVIRNQSGKLLYSYYSHLICLSVGCSPIPPHGTIMATGLLPSTDQCTAGILSTGGCFHVALSKLSTRPCPSQPSSLSSRCPLPSLGKSTMNTPLCPSLPMSYWGASQSQLVRVVRMNSCLPITGKEQSKTSKNWKRRRDIHEFMKEQEDFSAKFGRILGNTMIRRTSDNKTARKPIAILPKTLL